jgi:hypothetical protein
MAKIRPNPVTLFAVHKFRLKDKLGRWRDYKERGIPNGKRDHNIFTIGTKISTGSQGCQIFLGTTYQNGKTIPNNLKISQMATKYTK